MRSIKFLEKVMSTFVVLKIRIFTAISHGAHAFTAIEKAKIK
jgi:hypothetical protein